MDIEKERGPRIGGTSPADAALPSRLNCPRSLSFPPRLINHAQARTTCSAQSLGAFIFSKNRTQTKFRVFVSLAAGKKKEEENTHKKKGLDESAHQISEKLLDRYRSVPRDSRRGAASTRIDGADARLSEPHKKRAVDAL